MHLNRLHDAATETKPRPSMHLLSAITSHMEANWTRTQHADDSTDSTRYNMAVTKRKLEQITRRKWSSTLPRYHRLSTASIRHTLPAPLLWSFSVATCAQSAQREGAREIWTSAVPVYTCELDSWQWAEKVAHSGLVRSSDGPEIRA